MARGGRLPRTAGRPSRFLRTGHRRATSLSEAHLQAAQRDAGHTLGREAEGVLQSLLFHRASRGLRAQRATFRVLAEGDPDVDAALASAVSCSPPPRSLTPPRPPLSDQRAVLRGCGAAQIVRQQSRAGPVPALESLPLSRPEQARRGSACRSCCWAGSQVMRRRNFVSPRSAPPREFRLLTGAITRTAAPAPGHDLRSIVVRRLSDTASRRENLRCRRGITRASNVALTPRRSRAEGTGAGATGGGRAPVCGRPRLMR